MESIDTARATMKTIRERFYSKFKVATSGCWEWMTVSANGYGRFSLFGKGDWAHRASWFIHNGELPAGFICHRCDNPKCVNPEHLFEGTARDNTHDALRKGRKLGAPIKHDPARIRSLLDKGLPQRTIAKLVGASQATVSEIHRGVR